METKGRTAHGWETENKADAILDWESSTIFISTDPSDPLSQANSNSHDIFNLAKASFCICFSRFTLISFLVSSMKPEVLL